MHLDNRLTVTQCPGHANTPENECEGALAKKVIPHLYLRTYPQPLQNMQCYHYFIASPREAGSLQQINYHYHSILTISAISKTNKKYLATSFNTEQTMYSMEVLSQIHSHRAYRLPMQSVVATTRPVSNSSTSNKSQGWISSGEHKLCNLQENSTENHNSILLTIYINYPWSML